MFKCNSGGALGADSYFEKKNIEYDIITNAFSYKTGYHSSVNKVEISEDDFNEGVIAINNANKTLKRFGINKYINLLARNWAQVKYSEQIIAISRIVEPGSKSSSGYKSNAKTQTIDGGTGWAVQMGIDNNKIVHVFDQEQNQWFRWSYITNNFIKSEIPIIQGDFAGIGTRELNDNGKKAIDALYLKNFSLKKDII